MKMTRGHFKTGALIVVILSAAKNLGFRGGEILRFAQDDRFEMPSTHVVPIALAAALLIGAPLYADDAKSGPSVVTATLNGLEIGINARTGGIVRLSYPGPGTMLDTIGQSAGIVELICAVKGTPPLRLGSRYSTGARITNNADEVVIRWDSLGAKQRPAGLRGKVSATVTFRAAPDDKSVILDCTVKNRSKGVVRQILFPDLSGLVPLAGPGPTEFRSGGKLIRPFADLRPSDPDRLHRKNPAIATFTSLRGVRSPMIGRWVDYGSLAGGMSLFPRRWGFDRRATVFVCRSDRDKKVRLAAEHRVRVGKGGTWRSGKYWLTPHQSGWAKGIEPYRDWVRQNIKRKWHVPDHIRKGLGFRTVWMSQLQPGDPEDAIWRFSDFQRLAKESKQHGLFEIVPWQTRPGFLLPLPPAFEHLGGDRGLVKAVADCKKLGVNVAPIISVCQVTEKTAARYGVTRLKNDYTYHTEYIPRMAPGYFTNYRCASVDTRNRVWQKEVLASCKHLVDIGVSSLCWDQFFIEQPEPNLLTLTREIRDYSRQRDPQSTFCAEELHNFEVSADYLDYTWNWTLDTQDVQPMTSVFPAPRINFNIDKSGAEVKQCFVRNRFMNIQPRKPDGINGSDWIENHPALGRALKQCARLRAQFLPYFVDGTFIGNCILSEPCPGTIIGAYVLPEKVFVVVLNTVDKDRQIDLSLNLPPWLASPAGRYRVKSYDGQGKPAELIELSRSNPRVKTAAMKHLDIWLFELMPE